MASHAIRDATEAGCTLHPFRGVRARHGLAVGRSVHGPGENYVGGDCELLIFSGDGSEERNQSRFGSAVGADSRPRIFGRPTANRNDAAGASALHERDHCAQNVKRAVEVEVEHALKGRAIGFGNRFAAGKSAHQMSQNIDPAESATIPSTVLFVSSALKRFAETVTKDGVSELDG